MIDLEQMIRDIVREELAKAKPANDARLTVAEYAAHWKLGESTVRAAIRDGRLVVTRVGAAIRIDASQKIAPKVDEATATARLRVLGGGKAR